MKLTILSAVVAVGAVLLGSATRAEAGPYYSSGGFSIGYSSGGYSGGYSSGYGRPSYGHSYHHSYNRGGHYATPYKVRTVEVNRYTQCRTAYDHCGRPYTYHVTVVTYCDHYSNGSTRTWTQTFS